MAEEEIEGIHTSISQMEEEIIDTIEIDALDSSDEGVIEIRPGTGGEEAGYFAKELQTMYCNALNSMGAEFDLKHMDGKEMDLRIRCHGKAILRYIRYEAGVHRVQRVPVTDTKGRVHTSTVSVLVLPVGVQSSIVLKSGDLKFESFRSGGPGGQNANMSNSAVRVTHIPTGVAVCNQEERSNSVNREKAIAALIVKLQEMENEKEFANISNMRRQQVKIAHRSEKIRTYNVCQNRVTDHCSTGANYAFDVFMTGKPLPTLLRERRVQHLLQWMADRGTVK